MDVIRIGCDLSNQCYNYKTECGNCSENWELNYEDRMNYENHSESEYDDIECDYDCENCEFDGKC